ncbi:MAG: FliM/FliN family flagellar motor switch protein [Phycisphaerales bacterium]|nr:FliM/FliN family flagellar motor switch protein [Phycisphaerales bacterium]
MSILDQTDIDALLASANELSDDLPQAPMGGSRPRASRGAVQIDPKELRRILHMRFPIIVTLAERRMPFKEILNLTPGSIIEFERASDADPDLSIGNRTIGRGQAVKVGEFFGLRVAEVFSVEERIRALGGKA